MPLKPSFQWDDPFQFEDQLSEEERMARNKARDYAQDKLMPRILMANRNENFDPDIMRKMGELGLFDPTIPEEYGCTGVNNVSYDLAAQKMTGLQAFSEE